MGMQGIFKLINLKGWRTTMEDAHLTYPNCTPELSLFGVFDGHGYLFFMKKFYEVKKLLNLLKNILQVSLLKIQI